MDRVKHGTVNSCARHGMAKLSAIEVAAILTTTVKPKIMAEWFGVTDRTVRDVRNNVSWKEMGA
jgi:hypothetical protein